MMRRWLLILLLVVGVWFHAAPAWGAIAQPDRVPLTVDSLQQRLRHPIDLDGQSTLDLRRTIIDLRPENADFRATFYSALRDRLVNTKEPLGIDLSYALVRGEFNMSDLGLRSLLYGEELDVYTEEEQAQLQRDRRRIAQLSQLSRSLLNQLQPLPLQLTVLRGALRLTQTQFEDVTNFANTFFLQGIEASGAIFGQATDWSDTRFSQPARFPGTVFQSTVRFRSALFFERASFNQARFQAAVTFQGSEFRDTANFSKSIFRDGTNLTRVRFEGNADFAQTEWQGLTEFDRSQFAKALFLPEATLAQPTTFREAQFGQPVNLRSAALMNQVDFGDASFAPGAYLNVAGMQFNPDEAKLLGNRGQIGSVISVPTLQGNETLLRNLVRNFRSLEQISDANQINYLTEELRLRELSKFLAGVNLNSASEAKLLRIGFSKSQVQAIVQARSQQRLRSSTDLLKLESLDLATYVKVRDRIVVSDRRGLLGWLSTATQWLILSSLLWLTAFGTSAGLVLGVGMMAIALYALLFWLVDRLRRLRPVPIVPTTEESLWMLGSTGTLALLGLSAIINNAEFPLRTLLCLGLITLPVPTVLLTRLYRQGRFHDQLTVSYFMEDGSMRELRILINRLPIMPKFPFYRERYTNILWDRRWNWMNYLDLSLNNLLRFGFNDIRLRDENLPGLITTLVWYQWSLGLLYIALLFWTLSRTIPGLNLLIYFK